MARAVLVVAGLCLAAGIALGALGHARYVGPGALAEPKAVVVPRGGGLMAVARQLVQAGVLADPYVFAAAAWLTGAHRGLKSGEYLFAAAISPRAAIEQLAAGRTLVRRLTVAEGLTAAQVVALVRDAEGLEGEVAAVPPEGSLLPETYHYSWGEPRARMIARQRQAMADALAELWPKRAAGLPLSTPEEAVTLASIVEKETGRPEERPRVAAVFHNRLRRGMRLQADPTVAYGLPGRGLDRPLSRADLDTRHAWNTYVNDGLPPSPIANPGRAALEAALNPAAGDELYFVSDGNGGHLFARTLVDHNRNVARLRRIEAERAGPAKR